MARPSEQPAKPAVPASEPNLGEALRALRRRKNWSLANAAAMTGLATSTLSRIENNRLSLTYEKLLQLSRGMGVDISELLSGGQSAASDAPTGRRTYSAPGEGRRVRSGAYEYNYLCTALVRKKMTPIIGIINAHSIEEAGGFLRHDGEEVVYVLEGSLELHTEFYEPLLIESGGCAYFDAKMGHAFVAVGGPAKMLSVCTSGEPELLEAEKSRGSESAALIRRPAVDDM